jgi:hypothetical protein
VQVTQTHALSSSPRSDLPARDYDVGSEQVSGWKESADPRVLPQRQASSRSYSHGSNSCSFRHLTPTSARVLAACSLRPPRLNQLRPIDLLAIADYYE